MRFSEFLKPAIILTNLNANSKLDVINNMVDSLSNDERILDVEQVRSAVINRENLMSTYVGNGFAIPHAKTDAVKGIVVVFGRNAEYIGSEDEKAKFFFMIISNNNLIKHYVKFLSYISGLISKNTFVEKIGLAKSAEDFSNAFGTI